MKKQLYTLVFAVVFCGMNMVQAACLNGKCSAKKERVYKTKSCSSGKCGK